MKTKALFFLLIAVLVTASIYKGELLGNLSVRFSNYFVNLYGSVAENVKNSINEYFRQVSEIRSLREQNAELEISAMLLNTFANELNQILKDRNSTAYAPSVQLVRGLSYASIGDYDKIWISKFDDYNTSKIYGLMYQGKSAGIVIDKDGEPLAYLQTDPKSIFAVYIGAQQIPGVAHGNQNGILIKFVPQWLEPKIGDEVFTSGLDNIFFSGVPVGKVIEIYDESLYKSVLVEPYVRVNIPSYLYVVTKER
ncbi:rod shape-determining protein MreC [Campylobacter sp. faydin G-24]|uniref:Rod shape-determining protein MreC n=1 Tax=Campylobacter anatolicus TaxID=2829105 RepID=A0ABS5HFV7_9BACT|nr:rod shape-determining protein MreC [Campylobacter anatolicus]MBR8462383.1 rod shape-determining protein MreC [Campylobacter anatolicus]MBR8463164.1 rod shape-determining protein MreC [Campylobacter anatolicus]MBR8465516.1 rod shape-determining protein MreC [Campylobacter anatolicus]